MNLHLDTFKRIFDALFIANILADQAVRIFDLSWAAIGKVTCTVPRAKPTHHQQEQMVKQKQRHVLC